MYGDLGEHFPVKLDIRLGQALYQAAVGDVVGAAGSVKAHYPKTTVIALFQLPVYCSEAHGTVHRLGGLTYELASRSVKTAGELQAAFSPPAGSRRISGSWHDVFPLRIRQTLKKVAESFLFHGMDRALVSGIALALARLAGQQMAAARANVYQLSGGGLAEPFPQGFFRLHFRHGFHLPGY